MSHFWWLSVWPSHCDVGGVEHQNFVTHFAPKWRGLVGPDRAAWIESRIGQAGPCHISLSPFLVRLDGSSHECKQTSGSQHLAWNLRVSGCAMCDSLDPILSWGQCPRLARCTCRYGKESQVDHSHGFTVPTSFFFAALYAFSCFVQNYLYKLQITSIFITSLLWKPNIHRKALKRESHATNNLLISSVFESEAFPSRRNNSLGQVNPGGGW